MLVKLTKLMTWGPLGRLFPFSNSRYGSKYYMMVCLSEYSITALNLHLHIISYDEYILNNQIKNRLNCH